MRKSPRSSFGHSVVRIEIQGAPDIGWRTGVGADGTPDEGCIVTGEFPEYLDGARGICRHGPPRPHMPFSQASELI